MHGKKNRAGFAVLLSLMMAFTGGTAFAQTGPSSQRAESPVLAVIGDERITERALEENAKNLPPAYRQMLQTEEGRKYLLMEFVRIDVFSKEARSLGLDKDAQFQDRIAAMSRALLAEEYARRQILSRIDVKEEDARRYYKAHPHEFKAPERIKVASIFIRTAPSMSSGIAAEKEAKARELLARAENGEDFVKLSEAFSEGPAKGEQDYFSRGRLIPDIEDIVFQLKVGEISPILRIEDGLIVFKLLDRVPEGVVPFDEVKDQVFDKTRDEQKRQALQKTEQRLFPKYHVVFHEVEPVIEDTKTTMSKEQEPVRARITKATPADRQSRKAGLIGTLILEEGKDGPPRFGRLSLQVKKDTAIFEQTEKGLRPATWGSLKAGRWLEITTTGTAGMSYPVQAEAARIVILPQAQ